MSKFSRRGSFSVEYLLLAMAIIGVAVFLLSNYLSKLSSPVTGATSFTIQNYRVADNFMAITIKNMGSVAITKTEITIAGKTCSINLGRVYQGQEITITSLKEGWSYWRICVSGRGCWNKWCYLPDIKPGNVYTLQVKVYFENKIEKVWKAQVIATSS